MLTTRPPTPPHISSNDDQINVSAKTSRCGFIHFNFPYVSVNPLALLLATTVPCRLEDFTFTAFPLSLKM